MKSAISIFERIRVDCVESIILNNLRERLENLRPGFPCKVLFKDREGYPHSVIWDSEARNFVEIHVHNEEKIEFNYIRNEV